MAGTVVAVFDTHEGADAAARALLSAGVPFADISLVRKGAPGEVGAHPEIEPDTPGDEAVSHGFREVAVHDVEEPFPAQRERAARAAVGATVGGPLGALIVATAAGVPGLDSLIAAGPLAAMLGVSLAGGVVGGLIGALTAGGIPEQDAQRYHAKVEAGATLVTVLSSAKHQENLREILEGKGGRDTSFYSRFLDSIQSIESDGAKIRKVNPAFEDEARASEE